MATIKRGYTNNIGVARFSNVALEVQDEASIVTADVAAGDAVSYAVALSAPTEDEDASAQAVPGAYVNINDADTTPINASVEVATTLTNWRNGGLFIRKGGIFPAQIIVSSQYNP